MNLTLHRLTFSPTAPTYGALLNGYSPICLTLERPWLDNAHDVSCIPPGVYPVIPNSASKPWRLLNVPGRSEIDIHAGNTIAASEGCILLGLQFGSNGILHSVDAINILRNTVPTEWTLTIINP